MAVGIKKRNSPGFRELPAPKKLMDGKLIVNTWGGAFILDANGQIGLEEIDAFTTGHCHSFALAVNKLTSWPIYAGIGDYDTYDSPKHVFNRSPKGFIDVEGLNLRKFDRFNEVIPVSVREAKKFVDYLKPRPSMAMPYAETLINKYKEGKL